MQEFTFITAMQWLDLGTGSPAMIWVTKAVFCGAVGVVIETIWGLREGKEMVGDEEEGPAYCLRSTRRSS